MKAHYIQHVPFEGPANLKPWLHGKNIPLSTTRMYKNDPLPALDDIDFLIIMGGPMSVGDEKIYPWLAEEMRYIETAIGKKKHVLGICLGAQLIAHVLGAGIRKNRYREIGWFPVHIDGDQGEAGLFRNIPEIITPFHWHGDTFDIPAGAVKCAGSRGCGNQAFVYNGRIAALQFHLEADTPGIKSLINNCPDDITDGKYIQPPSELLLNAEEKVREISKVMDTFLGNLLL